jgi:hypothetical protein
VAERNLLAANGNQGMGFQGRRDGGGKSVAINRQGAAGGDLIGIGHAHDEGIELAHLLMQQPHRVVLRIIRTERIGAHELGQSRSLVRGCCAQRAHLVQHHRHAAPDDLPSRLAAGQAAADDVNGCHRSQAHVLKLGRCPRGRNGRRDGLTCSGGQFNWICSPRRSALSSV